MSVSYNFQGKVVLITGGCSGIGLATAGGFAEAGARLALVDIDADAGRSTVQALQAQGHTAEFFHADVSDPTMVATMTADVLNHYGQLDIACNNAGIAGATANTADYPLEIWDQVIRTNLTGVWLCMRSEIPAMLQQGGGVIVNMASVAGLTGSGALAAYSASKHGVVGLTRTAALDYAEANIRINCVCPSFIDTPMLQRSITAVPRLKRVMAAASPLRRVGQSAEVAALVLWLCSDAASFVHGAALPVDGGFTAR